MFLQQEAGTYKNSQRYFTEDALGKGFTLIDITRGGEGNTIHCFLYVRGSSRKVMQTYSREMNLKENLGNIFQNPDFVVGGGGGGGMDSLQHEERP